jgi:Zn-dependent protease with chaperone function
LEGVVAQELSQIGNGDVGLGTVLATLVTLMLLPYLIIGGILSSLFKLGRGCGFGCLGLLIYFGLMVVGSIVFGIAMSSEMFADPTTRVLFILAILFPLYALFIGPAIGYSLQFSVSREHEFLADADAALLTRYPPGLARALVKIGIPGNAATETQASIAHLWIADPRRPRSAPRPKFLETHPPISERIEALSRMGGTTPEMIAEAEIAGRKYRDMIADTNEID